MIFVLVGAECCFVFLRRKFFSLYLFSPVVKKISRKNRSIYFLCFRKIWKLHQPIHCMWLRFDWKCRSFLIAWISLITVEIELESRNNWQLPKFIRRSASWDAINYNRCHLLHLRRSFIVIYCVRSDIEVKINLKTTSNIIRERMETVERDVNYSTNQFYDSNLRFLSLHVSALLFVRRVISWTTFPFLLIWFVKDPLKLSSGRFGWENFVCG